ncbi:MAG: hypothetical protein U1E10_05775 [Bdellovibrionales bacterium]|nr:hypothetical protein [Bdellovibrionales bacterium]
MKQGILTVATLVTASFVASTGVSQVPEAPAAVPAPQAITPKALAPVTAPPAPVAKPVESLRVRQMFLDRDLLVAEIPKAAFPASVQIGDEFIATLPSGKQCALKTVGAQGVNVTLDTKDCRYKFDLVVGLQLERSLLVVDPSFVPAPLPASTAEPKGDPPARALKPTPQYQLQEPSGPYVTRFSDFSFMPKQGQFIVSPYIQRMNVKETNTINRVSIAAADSIEFVGGLAVESGISDRMKLGVEVQHSFNDQTDMSYGPASTSNGLTQTLTSKGFFDPRFRLEVQALDQSQDPMSAFVALTVKPSLIEAKSATVSMDGTQGTGGGQYGLEGRLTTESAFFGFEVKTSFTYYEKRTTKNETANTSTEITGGDLFTFGLRGQAKFSPVFSGNIGARWVGVGAAEARTGTNPTSVVKAYNYVSYEVGGNLVLVPDRFMLEGEIQLVDRITTKFKSGTTETDLEVSGSGFRLAAKYLF